MTDVIHPAPTEFTADEIAADGILRYFHYAHLPRRSNHGRNRSATSRG